jgi:hypothetical protein
MTLEGFPFATIDWSKVPAVEHSGESGVAYWRTVEAGNVRVRIVEYSKGYKADHWCSRGHVVHLLEGELTTELQDGRRFSHLAGQTYQVAGGNEPHRSSTTSGAKLFIVD